MNKLKSLELIFENCEGMLFNDEQIDYFVMNNVSETISIFGGGVDCYKTASDAFIKINKSANIYDVYDLNFKDFHEDQGEKPFDRIQKYSDLVAARIRYGNDEEKYVYLKWTRDSDYTNESQSCAITDYDESLCIVVSENTTAKEFFKVR